MYLGQAESSSTALSTALLNMLPADVRAAILNDPNAAASFNALVGQGATAAQPYVAPIASAYLKTTAQTFLQRYGPAIVVAGVAVVALWELARNPHARRRRPHVR